MSEQGPVHFYDTARPLSRLEEKYLRELQRAPQRGELMNETVANLKGVLQSRGWSRSSIIGIEKSELVLKVLPYLDPHNQFFDDEPYPLGSNCVPQFVLRALFLVALLYFAHATVGASIKLNILLLMCEGALLALRNLRIRRLKRDKMRKMV